MLLWKGAETLKQEVGRGIWLLKGNDKIARSSLMQLTGQNSTSYSGEYLRFSTQSLGFDLNLTSISDHILYPTICSIVGKSRPAKNLPYILHVV